MLKTQLSELEVILSCDCKDFYSVTVQNIPTVLNQIHQRLLIAEEAINVVAESNVQMVQDKDVTSQRDSLQDDQSTQQTNMSDTPMVY